MNTTWCEPFPKEFNGYFIKKIISHQSGDWRVKRLSALLTGLINLKVLTPDKAYFFTFKEYMC